jgi:hypothetical protein
MFYDMKRKGVIEESEGLWSSPVVLVRKKNGVFRFCADHRKLNNVTIKTVFRSQGLTTLWIRSRGPIGSQRST